MLERELGIVPTARTFSFRPRGNYYKGHGKDCAEALRRHLGLGEKEVVSVLSDSRADRFGKVSNFM
jgi:hypothetical protein